ncbi:MAG: hypothetical protein GY938_25790 [Ketobacter sp.]|nr:hypothetical protein [Ketobacter sp.]
MKKLYSCLSVFLFVLLIFGCAAQNSQLELSGSHRLDINIEADTTEVKVEESSINNESGTKLSAISFAGDGTVYMKIYSGISVADTTKFWSDIQKLKEFTDIRDVDLYINSPGGDAFQGLALADQILLARDAGFTVRAHASGIIASAAVPIYAVCTERYATRNTIFMIHEAALWKWPGRETASMIKSQQALMELLRLRYIGILVDHTKTKFEDWVSMEGETTWFDVEEATRLGLVDPIK